MDPCSEAPGQICLPFFTPASKASAPSPQLPPFSQTRLFCVERLDALSRGVYIQCLTRLSDACAHRCFTDSPSMSAGVQGLVAKMSQEAIGHLQAKRYRTATSVWMKVMRLRPKDQDSLFGIGTYHDIMGLYTDVYTTMLKIA